MIVYSLGLKHEMKSSTTLKVGWWSLLKEKLKNDVTTQGFSKDLFMFYVATTRICQDRSFKLRGVRLVPPAPASLRFGEKVLVLEVETGMKVLMKAGTKTP